MIRGTHSIKDTLTAATGAVVPFHHSVLDDGGISNLVLGYAHCGMVAAARWIAKLSTPTLLKAVEQHPDYEVKVRIYHFFTLSCIIRRHVFMFLNNKVSIRFQIVGHSLGGGTAALLTYILREQMELSAATCVTFAPGVYRVLLIFYKLIVFNNFLICKLHLSLAACMTWELAESGKHFITTIINGSDLVPTFSTASIDDLRSEVC